MKATPKAPPVSGRSAVRGAMVTAVWTLGSRILGFARDAVMLSTFGASTATGNFVIAWMVPNLFRRLFGEGAVSAAVQPALARAQTTHGHEEAARLFSRFQGLLLVVLLGLVALGEAVVLTWLSLLDPAAADREALLLTAYLLPYVIPICLTALAGAPQQLSGRFSLPALAPAALNVVWISWLLLLGPGADILWLPLGVLVGGLAQWLLQWPGLRAGAWPILPRRPDADEALWTAVRGFLPVLLGLGAIQLNLMIDQVLVREIVGDDANSYTYAANRLLQLPMALVGISAATGAMPLFARLASEGRQAELRGHLQKAVDLTLLLMVAAGAGLYVLAGPVITVLFEHGRFTEADTQALVPVLRAYLWSLPASALLGLAIRACQASGDLRGPARAAVMAIPINLGLDLLLLPDMGVAGAGFATAAALTFQLWLLTRLLGRLELSPIFRVKPMPNLLLPGLAAAGAAWFIRERLGPVWSESVIGLTAAILGGILAASICVGLLLPAELAQLSRALRRRR